MVQKERLFYTADLVSYLKSQNFTERPGNYGMGNWPCREFADEDFEIVVRVVEKALYDETVDQPQKIVYEIPEGFCIAFVFPYAKSNFLKVRSTLVSVKYY